MDIRWKTGMKWMDMDNGTKYTLPEQSKPLMCLNKFTKASMAENHCSENYMSLWYLGLKLDN